MKQKNKRLSEIAESCFNQEYPEKLKRVDCLFCQNFIEIKLEDEEDIFSKVIENAKCSIGKRVMFRKPKNANQCFSLDYGYIRYCNEFKQIEK